MDKKPLRVIEESFSVRETILLDLEISNEFLKLSQDGMGADGGGVSGLRELRLVAIVNCSFVPT